MRKKVQDDWKIKQHKKDKNKSLFQQLRFVKCDIILGLYKHDKLEEELKAEVERTKAEHMEAIASLKTKHAEELRKIDLFLRQLCEK